MAHNISAPATDPEPPVVAAAATKLLRAGQVVADRYEIRERLGAGGMGAVYRVFDRLLSEEVALKVLRLDPTSDTRSLDPFRHETRLARKISHPNVCRVFDLGVASGIVFLTMELLPGETLRTLIKRNTGPLSERLRLFEETARGLAAVHARGILHRDLKPENVLVRADGTAVVADFGLALVSDESSASTTIAGTPLYMSPEQLRGEVLDARSDVFALGLLGYELLTGKRPFGSGSRSVVQKEQPPRPVIPELEPEIAKGLVDLLLLTIAVDPADRLSSAATVADAIAAARAAFAGDPATGGNALGRRGVQPDMTTMSATGGASTMQGRWVALHPTTGLILIAMLASRLLDTGTPAAPGATAETPRNASADENSHDRTVLSPNFWRTRDFVDDFFWHQHGPQSPRNHLTLLGVRRLGGERISNVTALATDKTGLLYVAGTVISVPRRTRAPLDSSGGQTTYIAQLSPAGAQQWAREYKSSGSDRVTAMKVGVDGNLYTAGQFEGSVDFCVESRIGPSFAGNTDAYVASYTRSGNCRWGHSFGDTGLDGATGISLDATDNVTVVGLLDEARRFDPLRPRKETLLPSMTYVEGRDESGKLRWPIRRYYGGNVSAVAMGLDGNMYLAGSRLPNLVPHDEPLMTPNSADGFLACLGANGEHRWSRQLGGHDSDAIGNLALDLEGNIYVAGTFDKSSKIISSELRTTKARDAYVASFTARGEDRWSYRFGGTGDDRQVVMAVSSSADILVAAVVTGKATLNGMAFEVGTKKGTIMALLAPSGELRDAILLQNCRISAISIAPDTRSEAYAAGEFEGTIDLGADSISSVDGPSGVLLKFAL